MADGNVAGPGLAASIPEKIRETFRNGAIKLAELTDKLTSHYDLQPEELARLHLAWTQGELDSWLNLPEVDWEQWPVVQAILHARNWASIRDQKLRVKELREAQEKTQAMEVPDVQYVQAIQEEAGRASSVLHWLEAREQAQHIMIKMHKEIAVLEQQKQEAMWRQCKGYKGILFHLFQHFHHFQHNHHMIRIIPMIHMTPQDT